MQIHATYSKIQKFDIEYIRHTAFYVSVYITLYPAYIYLMSLYLHVSVLLYLHVCSGMCLGIRCRDTTETVSETVTVRSEGSVYAAHIPIQSQFFYLLQGTTNANAAYSVGQIMAHVLM